MSAEIITKEDLQAFRKELLQDIKTLLSRENETTEAWLKGQEARKLLKISAGTLLNLRITGKLRYSKIGGTYYYRNQDIQNMLHQASESRG